MFEELNEEDSRVLEHIKKTVYEKRQLDLTQYREKYLLRRLQFRMNRVNATSFADYQTLLKKDPDELQKFLVDVTVNVTSFFRDMSVYEALKNDILPDIIGKKRGNRHRMIRVWSAGASGGEEAYSVAILLLELLGNDLDGFMLSIHGTDIDDACINEAKEGIYVIDRFKEMPESYKKRYFTQCDNGTLQICNQVKRLVEFHHGDLFAQKSEYRNVDLILCRNVVIYFEQNMKNHLYQQFYDTLNPGGYFVMGKTEMLTGPARERFKLVNGRERIYQKPPKEAKSCQ